jgi:hypothetical protein
MTQLHRRPFTSEPNDAGGNSLYGRSAPNLTGPKAVDAAIDAALRSVPLPDGLMTRLGMLVFLMPDEATDPVDWLGC